MSTRCQVQVVETGVNFGEKVTLYHHTDGYPSNIILLIKKCYTKFSKPKKYAFGKVCRKWELGRPGKVASFLCAIDPGVFEPEEGHDLHGDIEYYYVLTAVNTKGGCTTEVPIWNIEIFKPKLDCDFWNNPTTEKFDLLFMGTLKQAMKYIKQKNLEETTVSRLGENHNAKPTQELSAKAANLGMRKVVL